MILDSISIDASYEYDSIISDNIIYSLFIFKKSKKIEFRCSYRLLPVSLKKIAIDFDLKYKKMPYPYDAISKETIEKNEIDVKESYFDSESDYKRYIDIYKNHNSLKSYTIAYCMNDVKITIDFLVVLRNMILTYDIDILKKKIYSISSLSAAIFVKKYNTLNLKLKMNRVADDYIRQAYYGGRCEVFGNLYDNEQLYHFDFSGMYGQCMMEKLPNGNFKYISNPKKIEKPGFYDIIYTSKDLYLPILPHHSKKNGKLLFTNGTHRGKYWFEEINLFIENGGIVNEIKSAFVFDNYEYIFTDYIDEFNRYRERGKSYKTFGKLIINSLYGRLGMNIKNTKTIITTKKDINYIESKHNILSISNNNNIFFVDIETADKSPKYSNIAIAAAITSKARIKLYKSLKETIKNNGRILYSDTDSIFAAFNRNVDDEKQGEIIWKKEEKINDAIFIAPKEYALKYNDRKIIKIKGISKNIDINYDEIKEMFYSNKILEIKNNTQYLKKISIEYRMIDKIINLTKYDKRTFINNKKETIPNETND